MNISFSILFIYELYPKCPMKVCCWRTCCSMEPRGHPITALLYVTCYVGIALSTGWLPRHARQVWVDINSPPMQLCGLSPRHRPSIPLDLRRCSLTACQGLLRGGGSEDSVTPWQSPRRQSGGDQCPDPSSLPVRLHLPTTPVIAWAHTN